VSIAALDADVRLPRTSGADPVSLSWGPMGPDRYRRLRGILARRQPDLTVLMDEVHKPHNLAAVVRTCDAVGIGRVHMVPTPDYHASHRTAMGATRYVDVVRHRSLDDREMTLVAAHPAEGSVDYRELDYTRPTALLLGTELEGVSDAALAAADRQVVIPMRGAVTSLNVSVAAAIILYEAERQRAAAGRYDGLLEDTAEVRRTLFEWAYPRIAGLCRRRGVAYPPLDEEGEIVGEVPR
jgi:tRNA (guanosine-2'-O-)-methyltransferase